MPNLFVLKLLGAGLMFGSLVVITREQPLGVMVAMVALAVLQAYLWFTVGRVQQHIKTCMYFLLKERGGNHGSFK